MIVSVASGTGSPRAPATNVASTRVGDAAAAAAADVDVDVDAESDSVASDGSIFMRGSPSDAKTGPASSTVARRDRPLPTRRSPAGRAA